MSHSFDLAGCPVPILFMSESNPRTATEFTDREKKVKSGFIGFLGHATIRWGVAEAGYYSMLFWGSHE